MRNQPDAAGPAVPVPTSQAMRDAVRHLLDVLTADQRLKACVRFEDHQARTDWSYFPRRFPGLSLSELDHRQRKAAQRLLRSGVSASGYARARQIMA
ncbi:MAG: DUF3500 domain-containing protein, partial [Nocardioides sp.]